MKIVKVKKSWLYRSDLRLDASYHLSDGVNTKRIIAELCPYPNVSLKEETSELFKGDIHKRVYVKFPENGVMFYTASDLFKSDLNSGKYLSKKYSPHLKELELKKDWILVTRSGTLGKVFYTTSDYEGKIGTDDLLRIKPAQRNIKKGYLYAFLSSKYGYGLLTQSSYGGVVKHIEPHHIEDIDVPVLPKKCQSQIDDLITEATNLRVQANKLLTKAQNYFDEMLYRKGSKKISTIHIKKISELKLFQSRLDASFNIYKKELDNIIENCGIPYFRLSNYLERVFIPNRGKRVYVEKGLKYLSTSDLSTFNPTRIEKFLSLKMVGVETLRVKKNWILVARSGQEILGSTFFVGENLDSLGVNEHALRVLVDEDISPYVYAFLSSKFGKQYLRSGIFGSAILTINDDFIKELIIPDFDDTTKIIITDLVIKSTQLFDLSMNKENQAIDIVEKEIESWQE
ncbi:restriction endonuclease subunit S [Chryseobacterium indologenes]|uniref:Restriction endonuclease subunit S n=1 Tax=Chryseobacterium indologenes TaxID=253 RepID=A0AAD1DVS3_CHRID|nr:restriction endonuclease subunit S [Chryseobacterium indologenes]AZB17517.1 restriction endonuclease subunit S [Chryseobacterium indologenes]